MEIRNTTIISPSGNFYGSEQVLFNFLSNTAKSYTVYVPKGSLFFEKLSLLKQHKILPFSSIKILYLSLFLDFLFGRYRTLYINEGGHIKYAKILAGFLKSVNTVVHIRLVEDCTNERLGTIPNNLKLVSISDYISSHLENYHHTKIYDPIDTAPIRSNKPVKNNNTFNIGIVGRISKTKGLSYYDALFEYLCAENFNSTVSFNFYGDVVNQENEAQMFYDRYVNHKKLKINFKGYEKSQESLYANIDMVLHLNPKEPLGRIGLESWARGIPFVCFSSGGAGEINQRLDLQNYSIALNDSWPITLKKLIEGMMTDISSHDIEKAKAGVAKYFGVSRYVTELEKLF